jgi:uncharacterized tellurite resistance protein B-like protein
MRDRINIVADLLMGAAHADNRFEGSEKETVRELLRNLLGGERLPIDLEFHLDEFQPARFDVGEAGAAFAGDSTETKRHLLELIAAVGGADREFDIAEDEYLHRVGMAVGLAEEAFHDLLATLVEEIDLVEGLEVVRYSEDVAEEGPRPPMPPPPGAKRHAGKKKV